MTSPVLSLFNFEVNVRLLLGRLNILFSRLNIKFISVKTSEKFKVYPQISCAKIYVELLPKYPDKANEIFYTVISYDAKSYTKISNRTDTLLARYSSFSKIPGQPCL